MIGNSEADQFILDSLPDTFMGLYLRADRHFGCETYRKIDARLQSLRKRGFIKFDRIKGQGSVWSKAA